MKIHKQRGLLAALLVTAMACATLVQAQDKKEGADSKDAPARKGRPTVEQRMERMTKDLELTDDQKPKVKEVLEESQKKMQDLRNDSSSDPSSRGEKRTEIMKEQDKKLKDILTADQYTKYEKMRDEMRKKGGPGGGPDGGKKKKKQQDV
jgi:protein CpxP